MYYRTLYSEYVGLILILYLSTNIVKEIRVVFFSTKLLKFRIQSKIHENLPPVSGSIRFPCALSTKTSSEVSKCTVRNGMSFDNIVARVIGVEQRTRHHKSMETSIVRLSQILKT